VADIERELAAARERLDGAAKKTSEVAKSEQALRQQLESLTRTDLGEDGRRGRSKVAARAYREVLVKLEQEQAERTRAEDEAARLSDQVRQLEQQLQQRPAAATDPAVEEDLRHLLAARQRELDEVRTALNEQRARYAAVASQLTPNQLAESTEPRTEKPWTAVDEDLLDRIQRAKDLAGQD
jgi:chromosome segregation ATPase